MNDSCSHCKKPLYFGVKAYDKKREFCSADCFAKDRAKQLLDPDHIVLPDPMQNIAEGALHKAKVDIDRAIAELQRIKEIIG